MLSKLISELKSKTPPTPPQPPNKPILTHYHSLPVALPPTFLTTPAPDTLPIEITPIDWSTTPIPENTGLYAVVLDNVLSPSECTTLLSLAEASVPSPGETGGELRNGPDDAWGPALVNVGGGFEVLDGGYRNGDRIVWDCQEVVDRVWGRCLQGDGETVLGE
ncbi:hypothetical protein C8A00DRAFT_35865, partial [Chaetomidium leptoderma]